MKMKSVIGGLMIQGIVLAAAIVPASGQTNDAGLRNFSFKEGEKLEFRVYYNMGFIWINSGTAVFTVKSDTLRDKKAYHITGRGSTAKSFEWFYKVSDTYESYVEKETMLPLRFIRNVNEGGMKIHNDVTFHHEKGIAISDKTTYATPKGTQDVLSAIYFARNINYNKYKPGDKIPFTMFLDNQVYNLYIKYLGKERITTKSGTFDAIKIAPLLIEGTIFKGGEKMVVYVSDDANHLPLRIDSPILVGSIKVDLVGYENLRNPFAGSISKK